MPDPIERARQLIASRLTALDAERRGLESALRGMEQGTPVKAKRGGTRKASAAGPREGKAASASKASGRETKATSSRKPKASRAPRGQRREQLLAAIEANPGARPVELARSIGVKPTQVHALIAKARADKLIVKRGNGYKPKP